MTGAIGPLIAALAEHPVLALSSREPSLEEIFLHHYDSPRERCTRLARRGRRASRGRASRPQPRSRERAFRDARVRTIGFAYLFALYAYIQPVGYRHAYPTHAARLAFAHSFASNDALRLFYGYPYSPLERQRLQRLAGRRNARDHSRPSTACWRPYAPFAREEDTGRIELILAGPVARRTTFLVGNRRRRRRRCGSLARADRGLHPRRPAGGRLGLPGAGDDVRDPRLRRRRRPRQPARIDTPRSRSSCRGRRSGLSLLLRVIADTSSGAAWLRWTTPLGWAEELRPFAGPQPLVLLLRAAAGVVLLAIAARIAAARDIGTGILPDATPHHRGCGCCPRRPRRRCAPSVPSLIVWAVSIGAFAFILGMISTSISSAGISKSVQREIAKLGVGSIQTPSGYISFVFIFFVLAVSLFACAQIAAARHEEADGRLETLLSLPVGRRGWLAGRLLLATLAAAALSLLAGVLAWAGAASQGVEHLAAADARGRRELPAGRAAVPRACRTRLRGRASGQRRHRLRARHRHVPVAVDRISCSAPRNGFST